MRLLGPLDSLDKRVVVAFAPGIGEHESTDGVALLISTMRVELSSLVSGLHVDLGLINEAGDLNIVGSREELNTLQGTSGNNTSAMALFRAPCNFRCLGVGNQCVGGGRRPQAKV